MQIKFNVTFLKRVYVIQERDSQNELFSIYQPKQTRWNPWHPVSYLVWLCLYAVKLSYDILNSIRGIIQTKPFDWV